MTAPGNNLDFMASAHFRARAESALGLLEANKKVLRENLRAGVEILPGIRELALELEGRAFVVIFARRSNAFGLMHVYESHEEQALAAQKKYLIDSFKKRGQS